jgi:hypothetical protein
MRAQRALPGHENPSAFHFSIRIVTLFGILCFFLILLDADIQAEPGWSLLGVMKRRD